MFTKSRLYHMGGIPVLGGGLPFTTGSVFFVHSGTGSDGYEGKTVETPFATLDFALSKCTANKNDIVILMPNHAETVTGAGAITLDVAGVQVWGIGHYDNRPRFLMDGGTAVTMLVTAANNWMHNCVFAAGHADIVKFGHVTAKGFRFTNCKLEENIATENFVRSLTAGTADNDFDGLEVLGCEFDAVDTASVSAIELSKNSRDVKIVGNKICGDFGNTTFAPIYSPSAEISKNIFVTDNIIHNLHNADAAVGISIANTASTGAIVRNLVGHQDAAGETPILAGAAGLLVAENYCSGVLGTASGYIYPAIDS